MNKYARNNSAASKLTPSEVAKIRAQYAQGQTQGSLCREFGVSVVQIGRIVRGEVWQHLPQQAAVLSPGEIKQREERLLAISQGDRVATMAQEFEEMLKAEGPAEPTRVHRSPLDDGDIPAESEGALSVLEQQARAMGADIEKLRSKP